MSLTAELAKAATGERVVGNREEGRSDACGASLGLLGLPLLADKSIGDVVSPRTPERHGYRSG